MPTNRAPSKIDTRYVTPFFQPLGPQSAKSLDHAFADKFDRLRELIYQAETKETISLSEVRFRTGARTGSLHIMSQRSAA